MDAVSITAIIAGVGGVVIALYTHIKHSKCWGLEVDTYSPNEVVQPQLVVNSQLNTPKSSHRVETNV